MSTTRTIPAPIYALLVLALAPLPAGAQNHPVATAEVAEARGWAATCTGCHGPQGASVSEIPALAGRSSAELAKLMREFRDGSRQGTIMQQHAKGYTDAQIDAIAAWFAAQPR